MLWGIDLGGTKIEGIVLDGAPPTPPLASLRLATEAAEGYAHIVKQIGELIRQMSAKTGTRPQAVGVGHPGVEDPLTGEIKNSNTVCLNGRSLRQDLERELKCPVYMANDANCFALAEYCFGAASGAEVVFGVIMGTGVGAGIVVREKIISGLQGIAGEWGHNTLLADGLLCYCGRRGCVETLISGPATERYYESRTGKKTSLQDIVREASLGDAAAEETVRRLCSLFGQAIAGVINVLDPHCIVLGGGLSNIERLYTEGKREAGKWVFNNRLETPIVRNRLGDSAGVYGAAMLAKA